MNYTLTYEDALEMTEAYKNFNFSKTEHMIDGYRLVTFTYFLCGFEHFEKPLRNRPEVKGYDMRGTTFVFNHDGTLYKRFLMLKKFFNINQVESTQYGALKDKKIKNITTKEDGSLVAFMILPNGKVFAKTQGGFTNEQAVISMQMFNDDEKLQKFVKAFLEGGWTPLFEYVSFDNRIVLQYRGRELRLIGIRNNETDEYISASQMVEEFGFIDIPYVKSVPLVTLDELIHMAMVEKDVEGWVVEFEDGMMTKLKTEWYFMLHGLRTMNIFREDYVVENYLKGTLDDLIGQLDEKEDADAFKFVEVVKLAVENKLKDIDERTSELLEKYKTTYNNSWTAFATAEHKTGHFQLMRTLIEKPEDYNKKKVEYILGQTRKLQDARFFVQKWSGVTEKFVTKWNAQGT